MVLLFHALYNTERGREGRREKREREGGEGREEREGGEEREEREGRREHTHTYTHRWHGTLHLRLQTMPLVAAVYSTTLND